MSQWTFFGPTQARGYPYTFRHRPPAELRRIEEKANIFDNPSVAYDAFHPPMPPDSGIAVEKVACPVLARLPIELWEHVFAFLSPQDLNTASWVSKGWRSFALNNAWLLSQVVDPTLYLRNQAESDETPYYRVLRRRLDRDLYRKGDGSPRPRIRYVVSELNFMPSSVTVSGFKDSQSSSAPPIIAADFGVGGGPLGYFIYQTTDSQKEAQNTRVLAVYELNGMGRPILICSVPYPCGLSLPRGSQYTGSKGVHQLTLQHAHSASRILISFKTRFSSTESPYLVKVEWSSRKGDSDVTTKSMENCTSRDSQSNGHVLLHNALYETMDDPAKVEISVFLERQDSMDCLYFGARYCDTPPESSPELMSECHDREKPLDAIEGTVLLSTPGPSLVYQNSFIKHDRRRDIIILLVIWASRNQLHTRRATLYLYEIPLAIAPKISTPTKSKDAISPSDGDGYPIQAMRVRSLGENAGGKQSVLEQSDDQIGGLAMFQAEGENTPIKNGPGSLHIPCPWRILVWGRPAQQRFHIRLEILSFTACTQEKLSPHHFDKLGDWASPTFLHPLYDYDYYLRVQRPGQTAQDRGDWRLASRGCHCGLHDMSYDIVLPQGSSLEVASNRRQKESPCSTPRSEEGGSMREIQSSAREAALRRVDAKFMEVIRCFRAEGMTDGDIANFWCNNLWSCWGQWPKPEEWRRHE